MRWHHDQLRVPWLGHPGEGPTSRVREEKRVGREMGQRARALKSRSHDGEGGQQRDENEKVRSRVHLLARAVQPATAKAYLREVDLMILFAHENNCPFGSWPEKDETMADYLGKLFVDGAGPERGSYLLGGMNLIQPSSSYKLPISSRCLLAWKRSHVGGEGGPMAEAVFGLMGQKMEEMGLLEARDVMWICLDGYLRESEAIALCSEDITDYGGKMSLRIGNSERQERAKTGVNQSVTIDYEGTKAILRERSRHHSGRLFSINAAQYRTAWLKAAAAIQKEYPELSIGPPHSARHSGPSKDLYEGYRNLDQVQTRGRWSSIKSVLRYAKVGHWLDALSKVPTKLGEKAEQLLSWRGPREKVATH
jgi:hypothetical protein